MVAGRKVVCFFQRSQNRAGCCPGRWGGRQQMRKKGTARMNEHDTRPPAARPASIASIWRPIAGARRRARFLAAFAACATAASLLQVGHVYADDVTTAIFVMKADGSQLRKVAEVEGYKKLNSPQWSHDGKRLAFNAIEVRDGAEKFFAIDADGGGLQELGENSMPHWSPDDKQ